MRRFVLVVILSAASAASTSAQPGIPVKSCQASFKYGNADIVFERATGSIMESAGFIVAMVTFAMADKPSSDHLTISVMIKGPGAVDLNQSMGNGIGCWIGGKILQYEKGKSPCTPTVAKVSGSMIEGSANCSVIHELTGGPAGALTDVRFSAAAKWRGSGWCRGLTGNETGGPRLTCLGRARFSHVNPGDQNLNRRVTLTTKERELSSDRLTPREVSRPSL